MTKYLVAFVLLIYFKSICCTSKDSYTFGARFNSFQCQADNKTIVIKYCRLKAFSRKIVVINWGLKFIKILEKAFYIQIILNYRYGTVFHPIIDTKCIEWCGLMDKSVSNAFLNFAINQLRKTASELFHKCPYEGEIDISNATLDSTLYDKNTQLFPEGIYRADVFLFKNNLKILKALIGFELKTPLKETFG